MTARLTDVINVFLASPGDLDVERDAVSNAIEELNRGLGLHLNKRIELIRWETHATPGLGSDPQEVINKQVRDDYEIFIGLLWTRFGTPTIRAESGTIEEFERARARWQQDPTRVSVMFYFKNEQLSPSDIDAEQLVKVQRFKKELESSALVGTFNTADSLAQLVRLHLTNHLFRENQVSSLARMGDEHGGSGGHQDDQIVQAGHEGLGEGNNHEDDNEGLLDLIESANSSFGQSQEVLLNMTSNMQSLTEHINLATAGVQKAGGSPASAKRVIDTFAGQITNISIQFEADVPRFRKIFAEAINAFIKATEVSTDFGESEIQAIRENRESVAGLETASNTALPTVENLRNTIDTLPRMTNDFNRARRRLSAALASVHREFLTAHTLILEAISAVDQTLDRFESPS